MYLRLAHWRRSTFVPQGKWLSIYADGSYTTEPRVAEAGWYCDLFEGFTAIGMDASNFDRKMCVIHEAVAASQTYGILPFSVVFLIDSQAALLALSCNTPTDCLHTVKWSVS